MDYRINEKGKVFTTRVTKRGVPVVTQVGNTILEGMTHLTLDNRLKDELNSEEKFIAITDAQVREVGTELALRKAAVVIINTAQIVWITPTGPEQSQPDAAPLSR